MLGSGRGTHTHTTHVRRRHELRSPESDAKTSQYNEFVLQTYQTSFQLFLVKKGAHSRARRFFAMENETFLSVKMFSLLILYWVYKTIVQCKGINQRMGGSSIW